MRLLDRIGSVRFGVTILGLILVYAWIGSAGTVPFDTWFGFEPHYVRQTFDMNEMEWFAWWPFQVLVGLLCLSVTLVTIRKIPRTLPRLGVWTVHTGILILCAGSFVYFGGKIEGIVPAYRRAVVLKVGDAPPVRILSRPGETATVGEGEDRYDVEVIETNPSYVLRTEGDAGKVAYMVQLRVEPAGGDPFVRQLLDGYPQYTEDFLEGMGREGRAIRMTGERLFDDRISVSLDFAPAETMYLMNDYSLYIRAAGTEGWTEYPLPGLPRYNPRVGSLSAPIREGIEHPRDEPLGDRPIDLRPEPAGTPPEALRGVPVRVDGFLPFARLRQGLVEGGERLDPVLSLRIGGEGHVHPLELRPDDAPEVLHEGFEVLFRREVGRLSEWLPSGPPTIRIRVPDTGEERMLPAVPSEERVPIGETGYAVRVVRVDYFPPGSLGPHDGVVVAMLDILSPEGTYRRTLGSDPSRRVQDRGPDGDRPVDPGIETVLEGAVPSRVVLLDGPEGLSLHTRSVTGEVERRDVSIGDPVPLFGNRGMLLVDSLILRPRHVHRVRVVPFAAQDRSIAPLESLLHVAIGEEGAWVPFSEFPDRIRTYRPLRVGDLELLFSRRSRPLPMPIRLEHFELETYPGGERQSGYTSTLGFQEPGGGWSEPRIVRLNEPAVVSGWAFFQATWDPPKMNFSGIGVGNRPGVWIMTFGTVLMGVGIFWAFYIKPWILKRRREAGA